jgi:hypothetical protein
VTMTVTRPAAGQPFGPGFAITGSTTHVVAAGYRFHASLRDSTGGGFGSDWTLPMGSSQSFDSTFGINWQSNSYAVYRQQSNMVHGSAGLLRVELQDPSFTVVEGIDVAVVYDALTGVEYLVGWVGANVGTGGGGHDPMLDTILDAVTNPYVNSA